MPLIALTLFLSITSCDSSNDDLIDVQNVEKLNKQKQILSKLEELGIDPNYVTFSEEATDKRIIVKSINELDEIFPKELNRENTVKEVIKDKSTLNKNGSTAKSSDLSEYQRLSSTISVPNSSMTAYYEFWYNPFYMSYNWLNGLKDVSVFLIGGNGIYFSYEDSDYYGNGMYRVNIYGKLNYPMIVEGQSVIVFRPAKIICFFNPNTQYTTYPINQYFSFSG